MRPIRFRFTDAWLRKDRHHNDRRFSGRWYTVTKYRNGTCWFTNDLGEEDGLSLDTFDNDEGAEFQYEEDIVDLILTKYAS